MRIELYLWSAYQFIEKVLGKVVQDLSKMSSSEKRKKNIKKAVSLTKFVIRFMLVFVCLIVVMVYVPYEGNIMLCF